MTGRRIVSIWLPRFPMERWRRRFGGPASNEAPLVLARKGTHGPVIHAANRPAWAGGARLNARVLDARALCPELVVEHADPAGDAAALERLALWCRRWCPWSASDGSDGIVLDATGSDHLWGGEAAMLEAIGAAFLRLGHHVRLAIAPTHGAAWGLARFSTSSPVLCSAADLPAMLASLPVRALRLEEATVLLLHRLGLKTVGALAALPRRSLGRRFREDRGGLETPLKRLDQALGTLAEPVVSPPPPHRFRTAIRFAEPVVDPAPHLPRLAEALAGDLEREGAGARRLRFQAFRTDGKVERVELATARPIRSAGHLIRLFKGRFETLDPGFGFDVFALEAPVTEPLDPLQVRLDGAEEGEVDLTRLIDRLVARLGPQAVLRPHLAESHVPERAERWTSALGPTASDAQAPPPRERPIKLLPTPEPVQVIYAVPEGPPAQFIWRKLTHRVTRYQGPERIAPEWWHAAPNARLRDYYRVEESRGRRYWLFREGLPGDGRGGDPRWFLHGLFA